MAVGKQPPLPPDITTDELDDNTRGETRWKRFHPLRVVRKIFRRRLKRDSEAAKKSWSTSELQSVQDDTGKPEVTSALKIGFSVSHDSIFSPEGSTNAISGEPLSISPGSSLTIHHSTLQDMFKDELFSIVHVRKDLDDGAGHHSLSATTTAMESLYTDLKENLPQVTSSTSIISRIDSLEICEVSSEHSSKKSSKTSLSDRLAIDPGDITDLSQFVPLNHKAAHHKIAVRPKRTHGLPNHRKKQITAAKANNLPVTLETREDVYRPNVLGETKTFAELSASSKHFSISSHSSEMKISSITFKEDLNMTSDYLLEEKPGTSTHVAKGSLKSNLRSFNEEKIQKISDEDLMTKAESQLHFSNIENNDTEKNNMYTDSLVDNIHEMGTENTITIMEDFSQNMNNNMTETNTTLQEESVHELKISSVIRNLKTNGLENSEEMHTVNDDGKSTINKNSDSDTSFLLHKNNLAYKRTKTNVNAEQLLSDNSGIDIVESKIGLQASNFPIIDSEFEPLREPTFKDEKTLTPLFFDEDSILNTMSVKESGIYVSHHSSIQTDLNNITEAHNFAKVEEVLNQSSGSNCEPWISSVDILASVKLDADVTVNATTSTICDSKINEDMITISVNSKSEKEKSTISTHKKIEKISLPDQNLTNTSKPMIQQPPIKEKQSLKTTQKHNIQEKNVSNVNTKNANTQKRVSVEIVPFSQRMKERKYQPISYSKKESPEPSKKSNTVVEKKLGVQKASNFKEFGKVTSKNVSPKSSFSEGKKGESSIEKKNIKSDKLQCPVQIRIQKSKPNSDIKDNSLKLTTTKKEFENSKDNITSMEVTCPTQSAKVNQNDIPPLKGEKKIQENATKREAQQTLLLHNNPENELSETDLIVTSNVEAEKKVETEMIDKTSVSDDPEPELLRVFARRSIKQKHCDKEKPSENKEKSEENNDVTVSPNGTVIQISETSKLHITKHELKKKSKSFCEKTTPRAISPLKEINLIPGETLSKVVAESLPETIHPRQRLASVSDVPLPQRTPPLVKEELLGLDEPPSWLQLAQQRRELREQRERLLLGGSPNSFMDPSNKPARSSKVWDMVNNFQKLQMT